VPDPVKSGFINIVSGLPLLPDGTGAVVGGGVGGTTVDGGKVGGGTVSVGGIGVAGGGTAVAVGAAVWQEEIKAIAGSTTSTIRPMRK